VAVYDPASLGEYYAHTRLEHFMNSYNAIMGQQQSYIQEANARLTQELMQQSRRELKIMTAVPGGINAILQIYGAPRAVVRDSGGAITVRKIDNIQPDEAIVENTVELQKQGVPATLSSDIGEEFSNAVKKIRQAKGYANTQLIRDYVENPNESTGAIERWRNSFNTMSNSIHNVFDTVGRGIGVEDISSLQGFQSAFDRLERENQALEGILQKKPTKERKETARRYANNIAAIFNEMIDAIMVGETLKHFEANIKDIELTTDGTKAVDSIVTLKGGTQIRLQSKGTSWHQLVQRYGATLRGGTGYEQYLRERGQLEQVITYILANVARFRSEGMNVSIRLDLVHAHAAKQAGEFMRDEEYGGFDFLCLSDAIYAKSALLQHIKDSLNTTQPLLRTELSGYSPAGARGETALGSEKRVQSRRGALQDRTGSLNKGYDAAKKIGIARYKKRHGSTSLTYGQITDILYSSTRYTPQTLENWAKTILNSLNYRIKLKGVLPHSSTTFK